MGETPGNKKRHTKNFGILCGSCWLVFSADNVTLDHTAIKTHLLCLGLNISDGLHLSPGQKADLESLGWGVMGLACAKRTTVVAVPASKLEYCSDGHWHLGDMESRATHGTHSF